MVKRSKKMEKKKTKKKASKKRAATGLEAVYLGLGMNPKNAKLWASGGPKWLARDVFLREMWCLVVQSDARADNQPAWIEQLLRVWKGSRKKPTGVAGALSRALAAGVDPDDLTAIVREAQVSALYNMCFVLDGAPVELESTLEQLGATTGWRLSAAEGEGEITSLHESFHSYDPEGNDAASYYTR